MSLVLQDKKETLPGKNTDWFSGLFTDKVLRDTSK